MVNHTNEVSVMVPLKEMRSDDVTKTEFEKFPGDRLYIQKEQDEKCASAKNYPADAMLESI